MAGGVFDEVQVETLVLLQLVMEVNLVTNSVYLFLRLASGFILAHSGNDFFCRKNYL